MADNKHTPGPWFVVVLDTGNTEVRTEDDGSGPYFIATAHAGLRETADNARLIAAAPDLYAFAVKARDYAREAGGEGMYAAADQILAAIDGEE